MCFKQFVWKEGRPHDLNKDNFNFNDSTANFARKHLFKARDYRLTVWRELVKENFHMWRRI